MITTQVLLYVGLYTILTLHYYAEHTVCVPHYRTCVINFFESVAKIFNRAVTSGAKIRYK